jgi:large repetitive protein
MRRLILLAVCLLLCGLSLWGQPPVLAPASLPNGILETPYTQLVTVSSGGYNGGTLTFSLASGVLPPGLTFTSPPGCEGFCGQVSGTPTATGTFNFTVQVISNLTINGVVQPPLTGTQAYTIVIYPVLAITQTSASSGAVGAPYSQTFTATGGAGASTYTWSLATTSPPPGLTFSAAGVLSGTPTTQGTYPLFVQVSSQIPTIGTVTTSAQYTVGIAPAPLAITGSLGGGTVGNLYSASLGATGGFGANTYTFSLASGTPPSGTTLSPGGTLSGTLTAAGTFTFTVQVTSAVIINAVYVAPLTTTQLFTVVVDPNLTITTQSAVSGTVGVPYSQTFTAAGGAGPSSYTWTLQGGTPPPGLTLSTAGVFNGTPTTAGTFPIYVQVSSQIPGAAAQITLSWFSVVIAATSSPTITGSLGSGTVGVLYSASLGATGGYGAGTYAFSLLSGALPSGLTFSSGGTLSGKPTAAGTFTFTVQVTNTYPSPVAAFPPLTGTQAFTVVVYPVLAITTPTANSGMVGTAYSQPFTATGGAGTSSYTWSLTSGTLPPGLTLSAAGALSGTPTTVGSFTFTVQVSSQIPNNGAQTASQGFNVAIGAAPSLSIAGLLSGGAAGVPYAAALTGFGGYTAGVYTFSLASGTLPAGITLSAAGTLSGTPTAAGTSNFAVQVTNTLTVANVTLPPLTAAQSYTVVVYPSLAITPPAANSGAVGVAYSGAFTATGGGGSSTYTWSLATGTLPPGLTFSAAGMLSGTPTASGTFSFTVQVSSQLPTVGVQTASQAFSVVVAAVPSPTIAGNLGDGTVGVPYSATLTGSGGYGTGTYTFSLTSGDLPADITLSTGGILSGTPTALGTSTFTVQVTSTQTGQPLTATQSFTITVALAPVPPITISGLPGTPGAATQPVLGVSAGSTYPIAIQGTITLTFAPGSGPDDPSVQFTTGGRTVTFQIPAGSSQAEFTPSVPGVQTGTVAGTITLTLTLTAAGVDITPTPAPTQVLVIAKSAPVITSATVTPTSGGFNLVVVGYSTTRDMVSAAITFTPTSGITLGSNSATVSLSQIFTTWYQSSTSAPFGSMFSLEIPFTIQNGSNPLASVSVALTNSQGSSASATAAF